VRLFIYFSSIFAGCGAGVGLQQASGTAQQGAGANGENTAGADRLLADPAEYGLILHQRLLPETAGHVQHIQLWGV
jgi:hypothetical protein